MSLAAMNKAMEQLCLVIMEEQEQMGEESSIIITNVMLVTIVAAASVQYCSSQLQTYLKNC